MLLSKGASWWVNAGPAEARQGLTLWILMAVGFMLFPFKVDYQGPWKVDNGVEQLEGGGVRFTGPSEFRTKAAPTWVDEAIKSGRLDIELELRSASSNQRGPARIVTLSDGPFRRNFMVAQKGKNLLIRARREGADDNGTPPLKIDNVFQTLEDLKIEVLFRDRLIQVFINNKPRYREVLKSNSMDLWDTSFPLAVGNEVSDARSWNGDLRVAKARVKGKDYDLLTAPDIERPAKFWHIPQQTRRLFMVDRSYIVFVETLHILFFLPFGALLWLRKRGTGAAKGARTIFKTALAGFLLGVFFQVAKLTFAGRHPSLLHVPFDMLGTVLGAVLALRATRYLEGRSMRETPSTP